MNQSYQNATNDTQKGQKEMLFLFFNVVVASVATNSVEGGKKIDKQGEGKECVMKVVKRGERERGREGMKMTREREISGGK
jgi:hypothetical protein